MIFFYSWRYNKMKKARKKEVKKGGKKEASTERSRWTKGR